MDKKRIKIIIVLIIIILAVISVCFYVFKKVPSWFSVSKIEQTDMETQLEECRKFDYDKMLELGNIAQPNYSEVLYVSLMSMLEKDKRFCELIIGETQKNQCLDLFFAYNYSVSGNEEYLNQIKDVSLKSFGEAIKSGNQALCPRNEARDIETCKAAAAGDTKICAESNKTNDKGLLEECESNVYLAKALRAKDLELCQKINREGHLTSEVQYLVCLTVLGTKEKAAQEFIDSYRNKFCPHKYAFTIAKEKNDSSFCELIPWKETYNKANYSECIKLPKK